jgi:hypothetical protein
MHRIAIKIYIKCIYFFVIILTISGFTIHAQCPQVTISSPDSQLNCTVHCQNLTSKVIDGSGPFKYQWYNDSTIIPNATKSSFPACYAGNYSLSVTNITSECTRDSSHLVIKPRPYPAVMIFAADSQLNCTGSCPNLTSAVIDGTGPFEFQWYNDSAMIPGATNSSFIACHPGTYSLSVTNTSSSCANVSNPLVILDRVHPVVSISTPDARLNCTGIYPNLTATVIGSVEPLKYQWYYDNSEIIGADQSWFIARYSGIYYLIVKNSASGCVNSSNRLVIKKKDYPFVEISTPDSQLNCTGICPKLTSAVTGGIGPFAYQWYKDNQKITGANKSTLTACNPGTYRLSVTNTSSRCNNSSNLLVIKATSCPGAKPPVQYGQFCEEQKVSGTGIVDMSTSIIDKEIALEFNSAMAGEGDLEMDSEHAYSQNADKLKRNLTAVNGSNESSLNLYGSTKLTYSGAVPLVGGEYLHSKEFYGGMGASLQEMFAVNEMEKEQTTFFAQTLPYEPLNNSADALPGKLKQAGRDTAKVDQLMRSLEGVNNPAQLVGINTKAAFNGTWGTDAKWHKIFYKDISAHEMFSGKFEAEKLLKFHQSPVPERQHVPCEGIDC